MGFARKNLVVWYLKMRLKGLLALKIFVFPGFWYLKTSFYGDNLEFSIGFTGGTARLPKAMKLENPPAGLLCLLEVPQASKSKGSL